MESLIDHLLPRSSKFTWGPKQREFFKGQRILVTGAGGYIGQEIVKQLLACEPDRILACDQSEIGLHELYNYVEAKGFQKSSLELILGSVATFSFIEEICRVWQPQIIIHAAAYKHVYLVEKNTGSAYVNNLVSMWNVLEIAQEFKVKYCLLVSSDKAKEPCNAMGYSKYLAELLLRYRALDCLTTHFCIVRFGNVLGSSGSLLPKLLEQLTHGWDLTMTHPDASRYFMSLSEAVELSLHAMQLSQSGETMSIDMGEPHNIAQLIELVVSFYRKNVDPNLVVRVRQLGLYPGERLHEPCLLDGAHKASSHPRIYSSKERLHISSTNFWHRWGEILKILKNRSHNYEMLDKLIEKLICDSRFI